MINMNHGNVIIRFRFLEPRFNLELFLDSKLMFLTLTPLYQTIDSCL